MKLYTSYLDDLRLNRLPEVTRWRYVQVYLLAFKADDSGHVSDPETHEPLTVSDIALLLRILDTAALTEDLDRLVSAGLLLRNGEALTLTRYADEQIDQTEYRKDAAERKARSRAKVNRGESQSNRTELNQTEREENLSVNQTELKRHDAVTRDARVTADRMTDTLIDDVDGLISVFQSSELFKLSSYWEECTGKSVTHYESGQLYKAIQAGIPSEEIFARMRSTALANPSSHSAYFAACLSELLEAQKAA